MKALYLAFVVMVMSAILAGCKEEDQTLPDLILVQTNIDIPSDGGVVSVSYELKNPIIGGLISANAEVDWIAGYNYETEGEIRFSVEPNTEVEERTAVLAVCYGYEGEMIEKKVNLIQAAATTVLADYILEAKEASADYLGDAFSMNGELNYQLWLSDLPHTEDGVMAGGTYYSLDLFAPALKSVPQLAEGVYTISPISSMEAMTISAGDFTYMRKVNADGTADEFLVKLTEGTLSLKYEGENVLMELDATDADGKKHHVTYNGLVVYNDYSGTDMGYDALEADLDFKTFQMAAAYKSDVDGVMNVTIQLTDMQSDDMGFLIPPGTLLELSVYMPYSEDGSVAEGTYSVSKGCEAGTFYPGGMTPFFMFEGSYATVYGDDGSMVYGMCTDGTLKITGSSDNCTVEIDLITELGYHITTSYTGQLAIAMPGPISTLTDDYTLNLSSAKGLAFYCGDYYGTGGGNWIINLQPSDGITGDGLSADIVCPDLGVESGITTGRYTASESDIVSPGYYLKGYMDDGSLYGTIYMGNIAEGGYAQAYAPAVGGDFDITNNGDGTYDISFSFVDDKGYVWDGTWSGEVEVIENTQVSPLKSRAAVMNHGNMINGTYDYSKFLMKSTRNVYLKNKYVKRLCDVRK